MSKFKWNEFGKLLTEGDLCDYLKDREYSHSKYFHYTKIDVIENILANKQIWISNVNGFNDITDSNQFDDKPLCFSLCFSTGVNENLPLWYLYSGLEGKGGSICLTKARMNDLIKNVEQFKNVKLELWAKNNDEKALKDKILTLDKNTADIKFKDIIYYGEKSDNSTNVALKYNTMTNYSISKEEFNTYKNKHKGFCKGLIWFYEKETRLLVKLKGEAAEIVKNYPKNNKSEKICYVVVLTIDDEILRNISIKFAPEIEVLEDIYSKYPSIKKHMEATSNLKLSDYKGQIKMGLCSRYNKVYNEKEGN